MIYCGDLKNQHFLHWLSATAAVAAALVVVTVTDPAALQLQAYVPIKKPVENPWATISEQQVLSGAMLQAGTNTVFHVPAEVSVVNRINLLGVDDSQVRYWGYCFDEKFSAVNPSQAQGFPGKLFLSRAERRIRQQLEAKAGTPFTIFNPPFRTEDLAYVDKLPKVRHQIDTFRGGMSCFILSEAPIPIGIDTDGDGMNTKLESLIKTDPNNPDSDGDGILDGTEYRTGTMPLSRDTDADGLIDGIEDENLDGIVQANETNPRKRDSDGDGLCDGYCLTRGNRQLCRDNEGRDCIYVPYMYWNGEDRNLSGTVDTRETDPRKQDTDGDGIRDDQEYYQCLLQGRKDC